LPFCDFVATAQMFTARSPARSYNEIVFATKANHGQCYDNIILLLIILQFSILVKKFCNEVSGEISVDVSNEIGFATIAQIFC
jgi:hypothetical protein